MNDERILWRWAVSGAAIVAAFMFGLFVWPTCYTTQVIHNARDLDVVVVVRTNRITGNTKAELHLAKWAAGEGPLPSTYTPAAPP